MSLEDFTRPITIATRTQFLSARAVARRMIRQGSVVILTITAGPPAEPFPMSAASTQPARRSKVCGECLRRNWDHMASGSSL